MNETVAITVFGAQIAMILVCTVAVLNVLLRHTSAVLYREGVLLFAVTLVALSAGAVANFAYDFDIAPTQPVLVVSYVLYVVASALIVAAAWYFGRDFVETVRERATATNSEDTEGGFENA